jgi:hypothetical protein
MDSLYEHPAIHLNETQRLNHRGKGIANLLPCIYHCLL